MALTDGPAGEPRGGPAPEGRRFGRGWRLLGAAEGLGTSLAVLGVVAALVYAASRPTLRHRIDLTQEAQYTLSEQTRQVLAGLPEPVEVTTIFRPEPQVIPNGLRGVQRKASDYVQNLLAEYEVASGGLVSVRHLDPHEDRVEVDGLVGRHHVTRYNVVLVESAGRVRQVYLEDLATIDRGFADPEFIQPAELRTLHAEGPLTSALMSVTSENAPRVGFLTGFGGNAIDDFDMFGLGILAEALRGQGIEPVAVDLTRREGLPDDLDAVALVGPTRRLGAEVVGALREAHEAGTGLLLALDPFWKDDDLDRFLKDLGVMRELTILARDDVPVEGPRRSLLTVHRFEPSHVVTGPIARQGYFGRVSLAGGLVRAPDAPSDVTTTHLVISPDGVFGDLLSAPGQPGDYVFDEGREVRRARTLAMAVEGGPGRVFVLGGSAALTNTYFGSLDGGPANSDLALNAVNWLVRREDAVAARPREVFESRVELYEEEQQRVFLYVAVVMPLGGALLGALVWFTRRR